MKDSSKVFLGFVAGMAAGAGVYALIKSEKGQQWVEDMKETTDKLKKDMEGVVQKGKDAVKDITRKFNHKTEETHV